MAKFQYEHPDLVREGITWTGKPGYITPVPDPARPDPVAAVETPKIIIPQDDVSYRPVPGWHRKECKYCGKAFWAKYGTRKYCQEDCYKVGNRADARRAYNAAHPEKQEQRYCVICRKPIPLDMSRSYKTCGDPECKEELAEQSKKAWYRQRKEKVQ